MRAARAVLALLRGHVGGIVLVGCRLGHDEGVVLKTSEYFEC